MIHVTLPQFEGPLGLLLYLIRRDEMDIHNIPIHQITSQYLEHLKKMRELDLEVAGEFVAMAATLIHIKSKVLLPQYNEDGTPIEETEDPRRELVQKLLEYQKFQEASKELNKRNLVGRDLWLRGSTEDFTKEDEAEIEVDEGGLFALISMYRKAMRQLAKSIHEVRAKTQSIASRILEIRERLIVGQRVTLSELLKVSENQVNKVLITFLSLLELTKMGFTNLFQTENYGDIYVDTMKPIERNVIERVEEYDRRPEQAQATALQLEAQGAFESAHLEGAIQTAAADLPEAQMVFEESDLSLEAATTQALSEPAPLANEIQMSLPEEIASDEEILAAERELGFADSEINLEKVDQVLAAFTLETPLAAVAEQLSNEGAENLENAEVAETAAAEATDEEFEKAWDQLEVGELAQMAKNAFEAFDQEDEGINIDAESQKVAEIIEAFEEEDFVVAPAAEIAGDGETAIVNLNDESIEKTTDAEQAQESIHEPDAEV